MTILFDISRLHVKLVLLFIVSSVFYTLYLSLPEAEIYKGDDRLFNLAINTILVSTYARNISNFNPNSVRARLLYTAHILSVFIILLA